MFLGKIKQPILCFILSLSAVMILSGCNTAEEITEEAAVSETAAETLSDEELNALAENMPEIVFVTSHQYDDANIFGCYITNKGEMKMYDFGNIAPDEIYEIPEVYDRLEEAVCSEIDFEPLGGNVFTEKDLISVPENILTEYYKTLLQIDGTVIECHYQGIEGVRVDAVQSQCSHERCYGIRYDNSGNEQFVLLYGAEEDYYYSYNDPGTADLAAGLYYKLHYEAFDRFYSSLHGYWSEELITEE
ncbi:MAG: hypothetical protein K2N72_05190 [Oscillospiraceae bacterium]|nr:hypothetical protein [Oscillospiraceae bacterium]